MCLSLYSGWSNVTETIALSNTEQGMVPAAGLKL